jgi:hypothetical protein
VHQSFFQMENTAAMQHVEFSQQVRIAPFFRLDEVEFHPREQQRVANPHDRRQHVHEAEKHVHPFDPSGVHCRFISIPRAKSSLSLEKLFRRPLVPGSSDERAFVRVQEFTQ